MHIVKGISHIDIKASEEKYNETIKIFKNIF